MIDWLTFEAPLLAARDRSIDGGMYARFDHEGVVEWCKRCDLQVEGSYSSMLRVSTSGEFLRVSGNPVKWFQGHNLFGTDDLQGLVYCTLLHVCMELGLPVTEDDRRAWVGGYATLQRVDCTGMYSLPSRVDVLAMLRAAAVSSRSRHGTATTRGDTVYWGQHSRRWSLKAYSKGQEIACGKLHWLPTDLPERVHLEEYADTMLRVELTLRGMELRRRRLGLAKAWRGDTPMEQLAMAQEAVQMSEEFELPSEVLEAMPGRLVAVYRAWQAGDDVRAMYCRPTFYRYRRELLALGIDISVVQDPGIPMVADVVPFGRVVTITRAEIPEWAYGTDLYFEPAEYLKLKAAK